jgi:3-hydroxybutyryl-CoA dehydratase
MYFEELEEGQVLISRKRVVTGTEIDVFATMTGATNPLFLSKEFATSAKMRDRVAPGALTIGLLLGALYQLGIFDHIIALAGIDKLRFLLPVFPGDGLESKATVSSKKETGKPDRGVVILNASCTNGQGEKVLDGELTFIFRRKIPA